MLAHKRISRLPVTSIYASVRLKFAGFGLPLKDLSISAN